MNVSYRQFKTMVEYNFILNTKYSLCLYIPKTKIIQT